MVRERKDARASTRNINGIRNMKKVWYFCKYEPLEAFANFVNVNFTLVDSVVLLNIEYVFATHCTCSVLVSKELQQKYP